MMNTTMLIARCLSPILLSTVALSTVCMTANADTGKNAKPLSTSKVLLACVIQLGNPLSSRQMIRMINIATKPTILVAFSIPAHSQTMTADSRTTMTSANVKISASHKGLCGERSGFIDSLAS